MPRAIALVPDLLFGSNLLGALQAGGHETVLISAASELDAALPADVLIVDLTSDPEQRIEHVRAVVQSGVVRTLGFFAHVDKDVRSEAEAAGFDLVVPRSRMARAASELVSQLAENGA